jgi:hypothetical protein
MNIHTHYQPSQTSYTPPLPRPLRTSPNLTKPSRRWESIKGDRRMRPAPDHDVRSETTGKASSGCGSRCGDTKTGCETVGLTTRDPAKRKGTAPTLLPDRAAFAFWLYVCAR